MAPKGDNNKDSPRLPSVKPSLCFMPGIEATQVPNNRLDVENKKPTARADLLLKKEVRFFIIPIHQCSNKIKKPDTFIKTMFFKKCNRQLVRAIKRITSY